MLYIFGGYNRGIQQAIPTKGKIMAWFTFHQNNSGGYFHGPRYVLIQANSSVSANDIAEENDIYFNGVTKGIDCGCCGDRWDRAWHSEGTEKPMIYDQVIDTENPTYEGHCGSLSSDEILVIPMEKSCK